MVNFLQSEFFGKYDLCALVYEAKLSRTFLWVLKFEMKLELGSIIFEITIGTWVYSFEFHKPESPNGKWRWSHSGSREAREMYFVEVVPRERMSATFLPRIKFLLSGYSDRLTLAGTEIWDEVGVGEQHFWNYHSYVSCTVLSFTNLSPQMENGGLP